MIRRWLDKTGNGWVLTAFCGLMLLGSPLLICFLWMPRGGS